MGCQTSYSKRGCTASITGCVDKWGCPDGQCPDFVLKRHDVRPVFKVEIEDCDGPFDLTDLVVETNMWAKAKFKAAVASDATYFGLADNIGFEQAMVGDIIIVDRVRQPEHMLVVAFDESNGLIQVQRGYNGTTVSDWKKGTPIRIMKFTNRAAESEMVYEDIVQQDGSTLKDQLTHSFLIHNWDPKDTCLPGCYYLEFKLLKMTELSSPVFAATDTVPSFTDSSLTPEDFRCVLGTGVEWVRRFPVEGEGFLIQLIDSPTTEF